MGTRQDLWEVGHKLSEGSGHSSFVPEEFADCSTGRGLQGEPRSRPVWRLAGKSREAKGGKCMHLRKLLAER